MTKSQYKLIQVLHKFFKDFVVKHDEQQFDISVYAMEREGCGFIGCVAGWAATLPAFKKIGFSACTLTNSVYRDGDDRVLVDAEKVSKVLGLEATQYGSGGDRTIFYGNGYSDLIGNDVFVTSKHVTQRLAQILEEYKDKLEAEHCST